MIESSSGKFAEVKDWDDRQAVLAAVTQGSDVLAYASEKLIADREVLLAAVSQDADAICYADKSLQNDPEIKAVAAVAREAGSEQGSHDFAKKPHI